MRQVSKKRARINRVYVKARTAFLQANPVCEFCHAAPSVDLHHRTNRSQSSRALMDPDNWIALCRRDHGWIGANPAAAEARGFVKWGWAYRKEVAS